MNFTEINPKFAIKSNQKEQQYPAVQVNSYKPQTLDEQITFCLSETSFELLPDDHSLQTEVIECIYGREKVLMHKITSDIRWTFLTIPRLFQQDKTTKEIYFLQKGVKLYENNKVTIAKCFLACLVEKDLVLDLEGKPQIFTLKLTSNKTQLIGNLNQSTEDKTIFSLNREIQKHFKTKDNLVHLVSVNLIPKSKQFISNYTGDSSLGVNFELIGNAKVLSEQQQQQIFNLVSDSEIQALFNDPFGLKTSPQEGDSLSLDEENEIAFF